MIGNCSGAARSNVIKVLALALAGAAIGGFGATAAHAQNYPWCSQYSGSMGGSMNCGFSTWEQCQANVSGIGGFCIRNDTYQPSRLGARGHR